MPHLSIIVPSYHEESGIESFLSNLCECVKSLNTVEVIVVDSSEDQTQAKVRYFSQKNETPQIQVISSKKGRALQMNTGARYILSTKGAHTNHYLLFLHADTQLPLGPLNWWPAVCKTNIKWGFFRVRLTGEGRPFRLIEAMMNWRSKWTSIGTGDQCLLIRSDIWCKVGGFKSISLMEDVEICKRLRIITKPFIFDDSVQTSSRRWEENGVIRTVLLMWGLRLGYFCGLSPSQLVRWYRSL